MRALLIETSTERGMICLIDEEHVLYWKELPFGYNQSKFLMSELQIMAQKYKLSDCDCIGVGIGPGSYTGIRIGVSVAKAFTFAWNLPLIGISTLKAFVPNVDGPFAAILDAKIAGVYLLTGNVLNGHVEYLGEPSVYPLSDLGLILKEIPLLVTPSAISIRKKLNEMYGHHRWNIEEIVPSPHFFGQGVKMKYENKEWSRDSHLDLLYLRKTQAEIEKG